ncbi:hypothetical protein [Yersinia kristensenii]|uniref:hypothetical protein n=1 Tax=Yersinia kristensenii TaxID=28152 RepID=UPI000BF196A0|nr:hypothetical protein [Yersinia kristensenii]PEH53046.1 hypothetical protein CRM81_06600 [Yersinia kristensenii]SUP70931.1 Uncharacterised protein [Yersinia kristensenii]
MGVVSYVYRGIHAAKELINNDPNDKSFLKAKPEVFSENESVVINNLISRLNKEEKDKTVSDKLSVPIEIDKMVNKSKEHLDFFLLKAQKDEDSCSYLIERSQCDFVGGILKEQPEMRLELVNFINNHVVNEVIGKIDLTYEREASSCSKSIDLGSLIINELKDSISTLGETNEKIKLLDSVSGNEHISSDLTAHINKHASYSVEPEIFYPLIVKYYEHKAESLFLPSMKELETLIHSVVNRVVGQLEYTKSLSDSELEKVLNRPTGARNAIYFSHLV